MALEIIDKKIVGTIDSLEAKLSGNIPIQIEELLLLINSWGRENSFYTCHLNQDMKIDKCEPKECYDLSKLDTSQITNMNEIFKNSKFNGDISKWDVSNVTSMNKMFFSAKNFNSPLNSWNTSNLFSMYSIFTYSNFNQNINSWDVSKVTDMGYAFCNTENFNQPLNNWNTSNVETIKSIFYRANKFNQDISTKQVTV